MTGQSPKVISFWLRVAALVVSALMLPAAADIRIHAQNEDAFGDAGADPVKLFERGQNAHARGDFLKAIQFYDEAIKVRPEFAEAEFQRATALVSIERLADAEAGFRRAIEIRKDWALPYSALGSLLTRVNRDHEADTVLRQALKLDAQNNLALLTLAEVRLRAKDSKEALQLARRATTDDDAPSTAWIVRAIAERLTGDPASALASLNHVIETQPLNPSALLERAEVRISLGEKDLAIADLKSVESLIRSDKPWVLRVIGAYELAGKPEEARRLAQSAGLTKSGEGNAAQNAGVVGTPEEIEAANSDDPATSLKALHSLLDKNPNNAMLLARLGAAYRTSDPARSLDFYQRANRIQPNNPDYAVGYSAALVQSRRFAEAAAILRRVIQVAPNNYAAHANLATALYELKQYQQAVDEFKWILKEKPDLSVVHYFIASAHDNLGEYEDALAAYEVFLVHADAKANQLEIEKVKLRLPSLRRQIKLGQGVKKKVNTSN